MTTTTTTRHALAITLPDGVTWLAAQGPRRSGPMRTMDPATAHTWESPEAVREWLDAIPDDMPTRTGTVPGGRAWMDGLRFATVPVTFAAGVPVPLGKMEGAMK